MNNIPEMTWLIFAVAVLATHRISVMISKETGPAFIFRKLRAVPDKKSSYKEGLSCQWCLSVYASALVTAFLWWRGFIMPVDTWLWWLGISSGAVCVNQAFTKV